MTKVFISYSRKDLNFVEKLTSDLRNAGLDVWYDVSRLEGGSRWSKEIEKAIRAADHVIMVVSPDSIQSKWVEEEFLLAGELKKNVVPLQHRRSEIPFGYRSLHMIDIQGNKYRKNFFQVVRALGAKESEKSVKPKKKSLFLVAILFVVLLVATILYGTLSNGKTPSPTLVAELTSTQAFTATPAPPESVTAKPVAENPAKGNSDTDPAGNIISMQFIGAGEFTMGSTAADEMAACEESASVCQLDWFTDSEPVHTVDVEAFMIDTYETTNALYHTCVGAGACTTPVSVASNSRADYYNNTDYDDFPVVNVTWEQAQTYCEWRGGRLPTEAEWEKAARSTTGSIYPWGVGLDPTFANYNYKVGDTTAVGSYPKGISPYGLYDMAGNVFEWTLSQWGEYPYAARDGREAISGDGLRIMRGGAWGYVGVSVSTSYRYGLEPSEANMAIGFRCVKNVP